VCGGFGLLTNKTGVSPMNVMKKIAVEELDEGYVFSAPVSIDKNNILINADTPSLSIIRAARNRKA
jgi:hypothetical protein